MAVDEDRVTVDAVARDVRNIVRAIDDPDSPANGFHNVQQHVICDILRLMTDLLVKFHGRTGRSKESPSAGAVHKGPIAKFGRYAGVASDQLAALRFTPLRSAT